MLFAMRGNSAHTQEFRTALETARDEFLTARQIDAEGALNVRAAWPRDAAGLQAVDYFLWALQRLYERPTEAGCDRYLKALWNADKVSLVIDVDDTRRAQYGEYYTKKKPLSPAALRSAEEYRTG